MLEIHWTACVLVPIAFFAFGFGFATNSSLEQEETNIIRLDEKVADSEEDEGIALDDREHG